jgi:hypothetical protein
LANDARTILVDQPISVNIDAVIARVAAAPSRRLDDAAAAPGADRLERGCRLFGATAPSASEGRAEHETAHP